MTEEHVQTQKKKSVFRWEHWVIAILLAVMSMIAFANIVGGVLNRISGGSVHYSLAFTEELTTQLFVWMTIVGSGLAFERGAHLGMISLYRHFPPALKKGVIFGSALAAACMFGAVLFYMGRRVFFEVTLFHSASESFGFPVWYYYAGAMALMTAVYQGLFRGTRRALRELAAESRDWS